jgi:hypothetical protein
MKYTIVILTFCMVLSHFCPAATIYVDDLLGHDDNSGTSDYPKKTISGGINGAGSTDIVLVRDGTYTGSNNRDISCGGKAITLMSENGPDNCTIDAESNSRVFNLVSESANLVIEGFTITGGYNNNSIGGGGAYISSSDCTIRNCVLTQNHADYLGGGMLINSCAPVIENCIIENNTASKTGVTNERGGGIYLISCPTDGPLFDNCTIRNNTCAGNGGGMYSNNSFVRIKDSHIIGNQATDPVHGCHGGGIYTLQVVTGPAMTITDSNVIDNFADTSGGGMNIEYSQVTLTNVLFEHNVASGGVGGGFRQLDTNTEIENCTFVYNTASSSGAAIAMFRSRPITPTTTAGNSIIRDNTSGNNSEVQAALNTAFEYGYCNIDPAGIYSVGSIVTDLGGNILVPPLFASTGYDNAGQWISGDYHLQSRVGRWEPSSQTWITDATDSLCIDAADPADSFDLEPLYNGNRRNIGRYGQTAQASQSPTCTAELSADLTNDCKVDFADFAKIASQWLMCNIQPSQFCW